MNANNFGLVIEANYPRGRHQTRGSKTNFQQTRLKISWPTVTRDFKHRQRRREIVRENPNVTLRMSGGKYPDVLDVRKLRLALLESVSNISHILPPFRPQK